MRSLDPIISTTWELGRHVSSWPPSCTSWIHIRLVVDLVWGPKLCCLQKGVLTHGVSHRVRTILGILFRCLSHTYPYLANLSPEKISLIECYMRSGPHVHVGITVCGFSFLVRTGPRNWLWYWVSVFPTSSLLTILPYFLINISVLIQKVSWGQETVQVLTRPAFLIPQDLGILKCSRTLVFTMTFTEQLSLPQGLVSCNKAGLAPAIGKHRDTLNVTGGSVWF